MEKKRSGWVVYHDHIQVMSKTLSADEFKNVILAQDEFTRTGSYPELTRAEDLVFQMIKPVLERDAEKHAEVCEKRKAAISKRYHSKDTNVYKCIQMNTNVTDMELDKDKELELELELDKELELELELDSNLVSINNKDNINNKVNINIKDTKKKREKKNFSPPTLDDLKDFCLEANLSIDPEQFLDYYTSNGWMVGKSHMKDWKATARNWNRRDMKDKKPTSNRVEVVDEWQEITGGGLFDI